MSKPRIAACPAVLLVIALAACDAEGRRQLQEVFSKADPVIVSRACVPEVFFVSGEADAGYLVSCEVRNRGESGRVKVMCEVSCSEGNFSRTQSLFLGAGQTERLSFQIHEPSVRATNCRYLVSVFP